MSHPFNPLDKANLGKSVATALLECEIKPINRCDEAVGAGVYALYYKGSHPIYEIISRAYRENNPVPIYVGKAIPKGGRKGVENSVVEESASLRIRLRKHRATIAEAHNLDVTDFDYQSLMVDDIWIPLGESMLIQEYRPVWNVCLDGFGNHDPGAGRYQGQRPAWDVVHPGRSWADKLNPNTRTLERLEETVVSYLREYSSG